MMTRKDYQLITEAIRRARTNLEADFTYRNPVIEQTLQMVSDALANDLYADNPRFDVGKFLAAASDQ